MRKYIFLAAAMSCAATYAQQGMPIIHDPSTIVECDGKYYTFGTGGGGLISEDGYTWYGGAVRPGRGAAPDALKIGDRYLIAYSTTGGGLGGGHAGQVVTMWNKSLDPNSPDFEFTEPVVVAESQVDEDCDAIDAGLLLDPTTGRLWCSYGTYFGYIRIVELDPATGHRKEGNVEKNIAIDCEATDLIYNDGWYYLLGTHGTCCDGANSTYNIVVGRSRDPQGPYIDNMGRDMIQGGGKMVHSAHGTKYGAGHFGRYVVEPGVEKMSCHYEADLDRGGYSVLAIHPLLWENGWPVAGEDFAEGVYCIESVRRGYALEIGVDFPRIERQRFAFWTVDTAAFNKPVAGIQLADVIDTWPEGNIDVRISDYMMRPHQKWSIVAMPEAGGYLCAPYYKIVIDGTDRALAATADGEITSVPQFTGDDSQLWRIEMLTDATYRIMPKMQVWEQPLALTSIGDTNASLEPFDFNSDNSKWRFKKK